MDLETCRHYLRISANAEDDILDCFDSLLCTYMYEKKVFESERVLERLILHVGKTGNLKEQVKEHRRKTNFAGADATHISILFEVDEETHFGILKRLTSL
ncbi:MAG: hypothetical protein OXE05_07035 [Chloroflexi bacterium]|nr:hypothetical protein [Chloroflexota bacterium]